MKFADAFAFLRMHVTGIAALLIFILWLFDLYFYTPVLAINYTINEALPPSTYPALFLVLLLSSHYSIFCKNVNRTLLYTLGFVVCILLFNMRDIGIAFGEGPDIIGFITMSNFLVANGFMDVSTYSYYQYPGLFIAYSYIYFLTALGSSVIAHLFLVLMAFLLLSSFVLISRPRLQYLPLILSFAFVISRPILIYQYSAQTLAFFMAFILIVSILTKRKCLPTLLLFAIIFFGIVSTHALTPLFLICYFIVSFFSPKLNKDHIFTKGMFVVMLSILFAWYLYSVMASFGANVRTILVGARIVFSNVVTTLTTEFSYKITELTSPLQETARYTWVIFVFFVGIGFILQIQKNKLYSGSVQFRIIASSALWFFVVMPIGHFSQRVVMYLIYSSVDSLLVLYDEIAKRKATFLIFIIFVCLGTSIVTYQAHTHPPFTYMKSNDVGGAFLYNTITSEDSLCNIVQNKGVFRGPKDPCPPKINVVIIQRGLYAFDTVNKWEEVTGNIYLYYDNYFSNPRVKIFRKI